MCSITLQGIIIITINIIIKISIKYEYNKVEVKKTITLMTYGHNIKNNVI